MPPFMGNELLRGDLVRLARPEREDVIQLAAWGHDMEYQRYLRRGMIYPSSTEGMLEWFASMDRKEEDIPWMIRANDDNRLIGLIVIKDMMWQARHCSFFMGIGDRDQRGQGYGTDAVRVMLKYVFCEMNMHRVGLDVMSYNPGAMRAYEKAGFTQEGRLRAYVYRDGVYYDVIQMSILRAEWESLYGYAPVTYPADMGG